MIILEGHVARMKWTRRSYIPTSPSEENNILYYIFKFRPKESGIDILNWILTGKTSPVLVTVVIKFWFKCNWGITKYSMNCYCLNKGNAARVRHLIKLLFFVFSL